MKTLKKRHVDVQLSAGLQHANHLRHHASRIRHVLENGLADHEIEGLIEKRDAGGVCDDVYVFERIDVQVDDVRAEPAGAGPDVEDQGSLRTPVKRGLAPA